MTLQHSRALAAYAGNTVTTASPARLLVMLLQRLVLDVERALQAQESGDHEAAHHQLVHAQAIVRELATSLEVDGMPAGRELLALYDYVHRRLVAANVHRDVAATEEALRLCRELCETWTQAALLAADE
jgi:flagellar protein FliS